MDQTISERARVTKGKVEKFNREFAPEVILSIRLSYGLDG
jgi:hypothetical protein